MRQSSASAEAEKLSAPAIDAMTPIQNFFMPLDPGFVGESSRAAASKYPRRNCLKLFGKGY
jgi:hypothetical protein